MGTWLDIYLAMEQELGRIRKHQGGAESPEEDALLDQMDATWKLLSPEDMQWLKARGEAV